MLATRKRTATKKKVVLLVEDEPDIAEVLRMTLEKEGFRMDWCASGEQALERVRQGGVDIVLLDILLPGVDGHEVCRRIRKDVATADIPVIMLTSLTDETDLVVGLDMGADDYISKPFSNKELLARIRAALRRTGRSTVAPRRVIRAGALEIDADRYGVRVAGKSVHLTLAEFRLLYYLARHPGRAFGRAELLPHVVGEGVYVLDRNIDVHIRNIRMKLGEAANYIVTVRGIGYRFEVEAD